MIGKRVSVGDGAADYHSLSQSLPESELQMNAVAPGPDAPHSG